MKKQSKTISDIIILTLLLNQVIYISGGLITSRSTENNKTKVTCLSENDGSALVWADDELYNFTLREKEFRSTCDSHSNQLDCNMNEVNGCLNQWSKEYWELASSRNVPMGLVFDQRWEEFKEYTYYYVQNNITLFVNNTKSIVFPFSVRTNNQARITISNGNLNHNFCYWIILDSRPNTKSSILKCPTGLPSGEAWKKECKAISRLSEETKYLVQEWQSFILMWNPATRNISLYDSEKQIMTYKDTDEYNFTNFKNEVTLDCVPSCIIRFHIYDFLYTNNQSAILTSNSFYLNSDIICVQMLVGLCPECNADILLRASTTNEVLQTVTIRGSLIAADHGLPMWRSVKIMLNNFTNNSIGLQIVMIPKLESFHSNPLWAIANVRQCPPKRCFKKSVVDLRNSHHNLPYITCQKLFYKEQGVVYPLHEPNFNVEPDDKNCPSGYVGPACKFHCKSALQSKADCEGNVICYKNRCTCPPGYVGPQCSVACDKNFYGHACKYKCGLCLHDKPCDPINGKCNFGCKNMENYIYAPPMCQIGFGEPNRTEIFFVNQTTIMARVPVKLEKQHKDANVSYAFEIIEVDGKFAYMQEWEKIFQNTTNLVKRFEDLRPNTTYQIICHFLIANLQVRNNQVFVNTNLLNLIDSFRIIPNKTSVTIDINEAVYQSYSYLMKSYDVLFENKNNHWDMQKFQLSTFPYVIPSLTPYTTYKVTISHPMLRGRYISKEVTTLDGIPSEVINIKTAPSSSQVNIVWASPEQPNGIIQKYTIYLNFIEYIGCQNYENSRKLPLTNSNVIKWTNNTEITFSGLHPYAKYNVQIIAQNSLYSSTPTSTTFITDASDIPAVTFSQLKFYDWILSWSPPTDCTAILGPIKVATLQIKGLSNDVKNLTWTETTKYDYINVQDQLYGAERYVAYIFALRDYDATINASAKEEHEFKTPPKAPPKVRNLEVVETYNREWTQLRWQNPLPPLNGILEKFEIIISYKTVNKNYTVQLNETCHFWNNYICKSLNYSDGDIQVVANNVGVTQPSSTAVVTGEMVNNIIPDPPNNFNYTVRKNGIVDLKWFHPWKTARILNYFRIITKGISSTLRSRPSLKNETHYLFVKDYSPTYNKQLCLLPSTKYNISIETVTEIDTTSITIFLPVQTPPSIDMNSEPKVSQENYKPEIILQIPEMQNDTYDSITYIVVLIPDSYEHHFKPPKDLLTQAGEHGTGNYWQFVKNSTSSLAGTNLTIVNKTTGASPLKEGSYKILIIITDGNSSSERVILNKNAYFKLKHQKFPLKYNDLYLILTILIFAVVYAIYFFCTK